MSCRIRVKGKSKQDSELEITGAKCSRGKKYAASELNDPRRIFTSTVKVSNGTIKLVPVRTDNPIRKNEWKKAKEIISKLNIEAPVKFGTVLKNDFTEKGIKLIAVRKIEAI